MKLSTKGRYGLKAMFELALHYGEGPIPLKNIAENQLIPENYLEQLISVLRKEDIVDSVRGAQGGYMLAKKPVEITVGQILRALEGTMAPVECVMNDNKSYCSRDEYCVTRTVWEKIKDSINEVVDSITLQDMVHDYNAIMQDKVNEFSK